MSEDKSKIEEKSLAGIPDQYLLKEKDIPEGKVSFKVGFVMHPDDSLEKKIITIFNQLLFKGACHFKRQQGITAVPDWIMNNKYIDFIQYFKELFARFYKI